MRIRGSNGWLMASAAVAYIAFAVPMHAQDTTRTDTTRRATSQQRLPVQKRTAGGEVALPSASERARLDSIARADSIARVEQMRQDSIARIEQMRQDSITAIERARQDSLNRVEQMRQDSIAAVERARADSVARADSIAHEEQLRRERMRRLGSGWYVGVAAGPTSPMSTFKDLGYDNGFNITVPIGWQSAKSVLGARLDLGYSSFNGNDFTVTPAGGSPMVLSNPDPKVWSALLNLTAHFPLNSNKTFGFYLVGGGGLHMFRNFGQGSALAGYLGNDVLDPNDEANESTINKWGVNGGAGFDYRVGNASLYLESQYVNVFVDRKNMSADNLFGTTNNVRWVPIVLGVRFH